MEKISKYCPMINSCPHEPVETKSNSYFLIQPFDEYKEKRETAINTALKKFYGNGNDNKYKLEKADSEIRNAGIYCDICKKIKSSQFCIVDITGELHNSIDEKSGITEIKVFLRPNVALELGLAYGLNKPALILSRKLNGKRLIPSDIHFVRYIDIKGWSGASQIILDRLRESVPFIPLKKSLYYDRVIEIKSSKKYFGSILHLKQNLKSLKNITFIINQIVYINNCLIGIIKNGEDLVEELCFNLYIIENAIERLIGQLKCIHVQPDGIAQVELYFVDGNENYFNEIAKCCLEKGIFVPGKHRLELIIPQQIENIRTGDIRDIINSLNSFISM
jgi:hypothetical protein